MHTNKKKKEKDLVIYTLECKGKRRVEKIK